MIWRGRSATRAGEAALWVAAAVSAGGAALGWRAGTPRITAAPVAIPGVLAPAPDIDCDSAARAARYTAEHDPFRLDRRPVTPGAGVAAQVGGSPAPSIRPPLVLKGIVGSAPQWQAVIEGIPGRDGGLLVAQGDTVGGFKVRRVGRDTVIVQGADTTWKLTVRNQWP